MDKASVFRDASGLTAMRGKIRELRDRYRQVKSEDRGLRYNTELLEVIELGCLLDLADVLVEGDTPNPEAAARAAEVVERFIRRHNDALTSLFTHGLLDRAEVRAEGSLVKVRVAATRDQIETLLALVSGFLGVAPPASDGSPQGRGSLGGAPPLR